MELSCSVQPRFPITIASVNIIGPSSLKCPPQFSCLKFSNKGCNLLLKQAITSVRYDSICQGLSSTSELAPQDETNQGGEEEIDSGTIKVCDKLIGVFMVDKPTPAVWRKMLAFSREWNNIRPIFFKRCQDRADDENDPGMKQNLLRLRRKLKEIDEDVQRHNELLQVIKESRSEISKIIHRRRKDFTQEFFEHLFTVAESYHEDPTKRNELHELGSFCMAAVQLYDETAKSMESLNAAQSKFQDITSSPSLEDLLKKIDVLSEKKKIDSSMAMMMTKAWSDTRETDMTKAEVKDALFDLYKDALVAHERGLPMEFRIMKYVVLMEDPEERMSALRAAFTPEQYLEGEYLDFLYTTPEKLYAVIKRVLEAYYSRDGGDTLLQIIQDMKIPMVIQRMEKLKKEVEDNFL